MSLPTAFEIGRLYAPIKAISDAFVANRRTLFHELPGLVAYYPMGMTTDVGGAVNHVGAGNTLIETGTVPINNDGNAYRHLGNGTNFLSVTGVYGLTGLETFISSSIRGFTIGGWFMVDSNPPTAGGLVSKDGAVTNRGYALFYSAAGSFRGTMSSNGSATFTAIGGPTTLSVWHFVAFRFIPSTELAIFTDGDKSVNTTAIPPQCFASSQPFEVGRYLNDNTRVIHAKARDVFVFQSALSDDLLTRIWQNTLPGE